MLSIETNKDQIYLIIRAYTVLRNMNEKAMIATVLFHNIPWPQLAKHHLKINYQDEEITLSKQISFDSSSKLTFYSYWDEENNIIHCNNYFPSYYEADKQWQKEKKEHEARDPKLARATLKRKIQDDHHNTFSSKTLDQKISSKELQLSSNSKDPWDRTGKVS